MKQGNVVLTELVFDQVTMIFTRIEAMWKIIAAANAKPAGRLRSSSFKLHRCTSYLPNHQIGQEIPTSASPTRCRKKQPIWKLEHSDYLLACVR